jgi:hypothetical protein
LFSTAAHAGLLDDLGRVVDTVKRGSAMLPTPIGTSSLPVGSNGSNGDYAGNNLLLPLGLSAYPRAKLYKRIDNPLERLTIPVSTPISSPDGYLAPYAVPVEGKVTMLQFDHRSDDSPLQIQQYYESWLTQNGFERLLVCEAPCKALPDGAHWRAAVDPSNRLDINYLPGEATYIAAYKADAMALVGIGKYINRYTSLVKIMEGRILDAQPWKTVVTPRSALPTVTPSMPAPQAAATTPSSGKNADDWFGMYGWKWQNIPVGTKLKIKDRGFSKPALFTKEAKGYVEKAQLRAGEEVVLGAQREVNGSVHVQSSHGEGWVDYRFVEPVNAEYYMSRYNKEQDPSYQAELKSSNEKWAADMAAAFPKKAANGKTTPSGATNRTETVLPEQFAARLNQAKGTVVVQFSSNDTACQQCAQANPRFDTLAQAKSADATFLRVLWPSQAAAFDDALALQYSIANLPTFLTFKDGKIIKRVARNLSAVELSGKLLGNAR